VRERGMPSAEEPESRRVIDVRVDATSYVDAVARIERWVSRRESRYVCVCNVHMVMEAHDDAGFRDVVNDADLVTPDGMPLVWALRVQGVKGATRVYGPRLMPELLSMAEREEIAVGFYGSTPQVLETLLGELRDSFPRLDVTYAMAPPFSNTVELDEAELDEIRSSGARILFVALGCPKQERWMAEQTGKLPVVLVGVGAAFDFLAGTKPQAPGWLQAAGLEWAFRLGSEPRRLWRRYLVHNPRFVALFSLQLARRARGA